jgi:hypothetical protein
MSKPIEVEWKELPKSTFGRNAGSEVLAAVQKLQERPGRWAIVQRDVPAAYAGDKFKRRGCEVASRTNTDTTPPTIDIYARWPEPDPEAVAAAAVIDAITSKAGSRARAGRIRKPDAPAQTAQASDAGPVDLAEAPPAAPSPEDIESALRTQGEAVGIQFPASFDFSNPVNAKAARERISFARGRARRANGR